MWIIPINKESIKCSGDETEYMHKYLHLDRLPENTSMNSIIVVLLMTHSPTVP